MLDAEPLHDLKGHLNNLFNKLPTILRGEVRDTCQQIIDSNKRKEKLKRADLRLTAIQIFLFLKEKLSETSDVVALLETAVCISEILYLPAVQRSPKRILQLYNCTWSHHTLCRKMFPTADSFYGSYLHHLVVHAPVQYEIISLSSTNAEAEERLFGQGSRIASQASNRHASNVVFTILTRFQAKKLEHNNSLISTLREQETKVSTASANVPGYQGTVISTAQTSSNSYAWQLHLKRISPFLICGEGIWWTKQGDEYHFHDGIKHAESHQSGPLLLHFRSTQLHEIEERNDKLWKEITAHTNNYHKNI